MNKKGFTLIELLAVIVILAIILLIAMPIVLDVINEARRGAFDSSAMGLVKTAENEYMRSTLEGASGEETYVWIDGTVSPDLEYSGQGPDEGYIHVTSQGYIYMWVTDGTFCTVKHGDDTGVTTVVLDGDTCVQEFENEFTESFPTP